MQFKKFAAIALLSTTLLSTNVLAQDKITLKNGDILSGTITDVTQETITFETRALGDLSIPVERVETIATKQRLGVFGENRDVIASKTKTDLAALETAAGESTEKDYVGDFFKQTLGWETEGHIQLGGYLQEGNTEKSGFNTDIHVSTDLDDVNRLRIDAEYHLEEENDETVEDNRSIDLMHDYFFKPKWFANSNLGFKVDKQADLDLRTTAGVGLGYQMYDFKDLSLSFTLGPSYLKEEYQDGDVEESGAARWALDYDQKFYDGMFKAFHNHEILQGFDYADNFQLESDTGVSIPVSAHISAILKVEYDFDNEPAVGTEREDTTYSLNIGYDW